MKSIMIPIYLALILAPILTLIGCASKDGNTFGVAVMEQEYVGENGKLLKVRVIDTPFSHNITNTMATYTLSGGDVSVTIGAARDVDQTPQARLMEAFIDAAAAGLGAYFGGVPGAVGAGAASRILHPDPTPTPTPIQ